MFLIYRPPGIELTTCTKLHDALFKLSCTCFADVDVQTFLDLGEFHRVTTGQSWIWDNQQSKTWRVPSPSMACPRPLRTAGDIETHVIIATIPSPRQRWAMGTCTAHHFCWRKYNVRQVSVCPATKETDIISQCNRLFDEDAHQTSALTPSFAADIFSLTNFMRYGFSVLIIARQPTCLFLNRPHAYRSPKCHLSTVFVIGSLLAPTIATMPANASGVASAASLAASKVLRALLRLAANRRRSVFTIEISLVTINFTTFRPLLPYPVRSLD